MNGYPNLFPNLFPMGSLEDEQDALRQLFGELDGNPRSMPDLFKGLGPDTPQPTPGGGAAPAVQQAPMPSGLSGAGPTVIRRNPQPQGGGLSLPGPGMLKGFMGQGGGGGGMLPNLFGGSGGAGGGAGGSGLMSGMLSNPWTAIPAAAVIGASTLSADADKRNPGQDNWSDWLGPVKNIPENLFKGDWKGVMSDGAMGPVGALFNIARGENVGKSLLNSLGPLGQIPLAFGKGELPYKGKKGSKTFINAFTGKGIW